MHKLERLAQRASPAIVTLVSPITTIKSARFLRRAFLDMILPLGVEVQNEKKFHGWVRGNSTVGRLVVKNKINIQQNFHIKHL